MKSFSQSTQPTTLTQPAGDTAPADTSWRLVWADEFDIDGAPDAKNWVFEKGFVRNNEHQWYQPENAFCKDGFLILEARREKRRNPTYKPNSENWNSRRPTIEYTSASMKTQDLHSWLFGRFEMRGRIDISPGMWPAFWTMGEAGEWPANGEIDIMEYYQNILLANVAWRDTKQYVPIWRSNKKPIDSFNDPDWSKKFHVWRMDWTERSIQLYVDDQLLNEVSLLETINKDGSAINPFRQPHFILLSLAVGGNNGGDPAKTKFPKRFEVDYVRVYQK
ncbi:glycoside hydrolase family 16 protein [Spirosoma aerophilum]